MILILCPRCKCALRVIGDMAEAHSLVGPGSEFWPDKFSCYKCERSAQGFLEAEVSIRVEMDIKEVSPQEAYAAIHGLGIMAERDVDKLVVEALMREHPVRRVSCKDIFGGNRVMVDHIELWDGTRLHFGSSNEGAVIYRITRPHTYVDQVKP